MLDVYVPPARVQPAPVGVFFYGGSWQSGTKATYRFLGSALSRSGLLTLVPDYRVFPEARFPDFLHDAAQAVRWVRDNAEAYGGDPRRIVLLGHSAGAYIAAMLAFDRRWLAEVGLDASRHLRGLIGLAGPYDFLPLRDPTLRDIFGPPEKLDATQPINFVDGKGPPAFLSTGRSDRLVDPHNTERLAARIRAAGGQVTTRQYRWVGHRGIVGAFAPPLRPFAPVLADSIRFVENVAGRRETRQAEPFTGTAA
jgi:acetyl esterase/lipase